MPSLCRDCLHQFDAGSRCPACRSPRIRSHPELFTLSIAHMDCDAFYATVEKRDNPDLRDKPVIIGGGTRGVVSTACYIARIRGVRSAMPMFQALKLCPDATVIKPRMRAYVEASRAIRNLMEALTPLIEPLSLDEAFLDLTGTQRLHGVPAAVSMALLVKRIRAEVGVTASVGLSHNKFLAKIASDLDKPRGYSVIGRAETDSFLQDKPVGIIWGVGKSFQQTLERDGIRTISDVRRRERKDLAKRYGTMGDRLWHLSRGLDQRPVRADSDLKSISKETTFNLDTSDGELLDGHLWRLSVQVSDRAKAKELAGRVVTLKLKRADFTLLSRRITLEHSSQLAETIYRSTAQMLERELHLAPFRLIGVGISTLTPATEADLSNDLLDTDAPQRRKAELATDAIRRKFGPDAIQKGRALR